MPIYEYQCAACGAKLEALQKVNDAVLTVCAECGKPDLQKLVSHTSFKLKGTGWYETDFKNKTKPAQDKSEEKSAPKKTDKKNNEDNKRDKKTTANKETSS